MQEDAEMPNPECKARNIKAAFDILIKTGKLRIQGAKKDEVMDFISKTKILAVYEDSVACKGRTCFSCEGCDSFRLNITEVKEILDRAENIEEVPPMKAATHVVEEQMRDIAQMMGAISQRTPIQFSHWEIIKFMRNSILTTINVDIFVIKNTLKNKYKIDLKKDDWIVIRTVMIINKLEWWLDDIKSLTEKENPDIFKLYKVDKQNNSYLPICMLFPTEDGEFMDVKQYIDSQPNGIRNKIMTIQNHFGGQIESTAKWTMNFQVQNISNKPNHLSFDRWFFYSLKGNIMSKASSLQSQIDALKKDCEKLNEYYCTLEKHLTDCERSIAEIRTKPPINDPDHPINHCFQKAISDITEKVDQIRKELDHLIDRNEPKRPVSDITKEIRNIREGIEDLYRNDEPNEFSLFNGPETISPRQIRRLYKIDRLVSNLTRKDEPTYEDLEKYIFSLKDDKNNKDAKLTLGEILRLTGKDYQGIYPYIFELIEFKNVIIKNLKAMRMYQGDETPLSASGKIYSLFCYKKILFELAEMAGLNPDENFTVQKLFTSIRKLK